MSSDDVDHSQLTTSEGVRSGLVSRLNARTGCAISSETGTANGRVQSEMIGTELSVTDDSGRPLRRSSRYLSHSRWEQCHHAQQFYQSS